jgi:hypothetical protein
MFQFPRFPLPILFIQIRVYMDMTPCGFPHSDIFGSKLVRQLPEAYRSLLRPSSVSYV